MTPATPTTRKLLASFAPSEADSPGGFVVPIVESEGACLFDIKSKRVAEFAVAVFIGQEVTANDLFAKLVDTGRRISDVEMTMKTLSSYIACLADFKIGNVVSIEPDDGDAFRLTKFADTPSAAIQKLS